VLTGLARQITGSNSISCDETKEQQNSSFRRNTAEKRAAEHGKKLFPRSVKLAALRSADCCGNFLGLHYFAPGIDGRC